MLACENLAHYPSEVDTASTRRTLELNREGTTVEFLVEFEVDIPNGTPQSEVKNRENNEAVAAAKLVDEGHLVRLWTMHVAPDKPRILGLYRADSESELEALLWALPMHEWMHITIKALEQHPNDPMANGSTERPHRSSDGALRAEPGRSSPNREESTVSDRLPEPRLTKIYRLEATLGEPLDLGNVAAGRRRIVPLTGGTFTGPEFGGTLISGMSADWQIIMADGTALGDIRYTLQTDSGELLYVRSRSVRHGSPEVLARLGRGEHVDANEYTFRTSTQIETAASGLDWLNKGVFIGVAGRQSAGVIYETYLVQ
jgi:muconolactone delta-isomerase